MGKDERAKKQIKRLQLRREVIRVLASDNLAQVAGGRACEDTGGGPCEDTGSPCATSLRPTNSKVC
jgi:hypothetical protein